MISIEMAIVSWLILTMPVLGGEGQESEEFKVMVVDIASQRLL